MKDPLTHEHHAERRKYPRYAITLQVRGSFFDTTGQSHAFDAETMNVSRGGVAILYYDEEQGLELIQSLLSEDQAVGLKVVVPPEKNTIMARGRVRWHIIGSTDTSTSLHYLIAGIMFEHMEPQEKIQWEWFLEDKTHLITGNETW